MRTGRRCIVKWTHTNMSLICAKKKHVAFKADINKNVKSA